MPSRARVRVGAGVDRLLRGAAHDLGHRRVADALRQVDAADARALDGHAADRRRARAARARARFAGHGARAYVWPRTAGVVYLRPRLPNTVIGLARRSMEPELQPAALRRSRQREEARRAILDATEAILLEDGRGAPLHPQARAALRLHGAHDIPLFPRQGRPDRRAARGALLAALAAPAPRPDRPRTRSRTCASTRARSCASRPATRRSTES